MKNNQNRLIILVVVLVLVVAGGWYFITQSASTPLSVATTTPASASTTTTGSGKTVPTHTTTSGSVTTTHTISSSQGSGIVAPQIIQFDPAGGAPGTQVTITGTNFSHTANYVTFGSWGGRYHADGTPDNQIATVASTDGTTITFTVPSTGASGRLCNAQSQCIEVSSVVLTPGNYPVTVRTSGGTSNTEDFVLMK